MDTKKLEINYELTKVKTSLFLALALVISLPFWLGSERQTVSTYYPSPYGSYNRFYGGTLKVGPYDNYLEIGTGDKSVQYLNGLNYSFTGKNYFYSNKDLYVLAPRLNDITLNTESGNIFFASDLSGNASKRYREYLSSFCEWVAGDICTPDSRGRARIPIVKGRAVGLIAYGLNPTTSLCCRMTTTN